VDLLEFFLWATNLFMTIATFNVIEGIWTLVNVGEVRIREMFVGICLKWWIHLKFAVSLIILTDPRA
jgi:hypothetical protein